MAGKARRIVARLDQRRKLDALRQIGRRQEAGERLDGAIYLAVKPTGDGAPV